MVSAISRRRDRWDDVHAAWIDSAGASFDVRCAEYFVTYFVSWAFAFMRAVYSTGRPKQQPGIRGTTS